VSALPTRNKVGLVLATVLALGDATSLLFPATPEGEEGPPQVVLAVGTVLGLVTLVAVVIAWRSGSRKALRAVAGSRILSAILALPAFFVDIPAGLLVVVAVSVALTVACVVLVLAPAERPVPVTD
jgi:hypothetical protein